MIAEQSRPTPLPEISELRERRLRARVRLADAAAVAGFSVAKASRLERFPDRSNHEDLRRLQDAVEHVAKELEAAS
jgi:hypothetical protein